MLIKRIVQVAAIATLVIVSIWPALGQAHTVRPAVVSITIMEDSSLQLVVKTNAELLLAGIPPEFTDTNDAPQAELYDFLRAAEPEQLIAEFETYGPKFARALELTSEGEPISLEYVGIEVESEPDLELARDSFIYLRTMPLEGEAFVWRWPDEYGSNVVRVSRDGSDQMTSVWLKQGEISDVYPLESAADRSALQVGWDYLVIGFEHIIPKGLDHILFVLGIFLLSTRFGALLWQVTAFTLAHTITLGLSIYGLISAPASIVEPLIALSIAYVGIENSLSSRLQPWRIVLVFLFGLLHGMGFAGVLTEIGLPRSEFLTALITFNIGVEFGQLAVICLAFALLGWWRNAPWYRQRVTIPLSLLITAIGLYWTWERVFG